MKMRKLIAVLSAAVMLCAMIPMGIVAVSAATVYSEDFELIAKYYLEITEENGVTKVSNTYTSDYTYYDDGYLLEYDEEGNPIAVFKSTSVYEYTLEELKDAFYIEMYKQCGDSYYFYIRFYKKYYNVREYAYLYENPSTGELTYNENDIDIVSDDVKDFGTSIYFGYNIKTKEYGKYYYDHKYVEDKELSVEPSFINTPS